MLITLFLFSLVFVGIVGNAYVIACVVANKKLRNWFGVQVLSVTAINFLVIGFLTLPQPRSRYFGQSNIYCQIHRVLLLSAPTLTLLFLITSVFGLIIAAWKREKVLTVISIKTSIILSALFTTLNFCVFFWNNGKEAWNDCLTSNVSNHLSAVITTSFIVLLIVQWITLLIIKILRRSQGKARDEQASVVYRNQSVEVFNKNESEVDDKTHIFRTLLAMSFLILICWVPNLSNELFDYASFGTSADLEILAIFKGFIEPILLIIINFEIRALLKKAKCW